MELSGWPQLDLLLATARSAPSTQVWLFGSAIRSDEPKDLDILLVYQDRSFVLALRRAHPWDEFDPPCHLIAMTPLEVVEYDFIKRTDAVRLI